jgi:hypothetical protein
MKSEPRLPSASLDCDGAKGLLSAFIDGEASTDETAFVQAHLSHCMPCRQERQSLLEVRNFLASSERVPPPENLALEARVQLSRMRHRDYTWRLSFLISDFVKPLAIRAVVSGAVTAVLFVVVLVGLISNQTLMASDTASDSLTSWQQPVRPSESAKLRLAGIESYPPPQPLTIEALVTDGGWAYDYQVVEGIETPEMKHWVWEHLYFAEFIPATQFGVAVPSRITLTFRPPGLTLVKASLTVDALGNDQETAQ